MKHRRFVIAASGQTADQQKAFREYLSLYGGWWHWIENFWLFVTDDLTLTCEAIRNQARDLGATQVVVFEFTEERDWAASGRKHPSGISQWDWLETTWADKET